MRLVTYMDADGRETVGAVNRLNGKIGPISEFGFPCTDMNDLIERASLRDLDDLEWHTAQTDHPAYRIDPASVKILAPIPVPRQDVICLGLNYRAHSDEAAGYSREAFTAKDPEYPVYFAKRANYVQGSGEPIPAHEDVTQKLDYECELAVILNRDIHKLHLDKPEKLRKYIFGYTICNDVSARDLQTRHTQWYLGKSLDGFTPMGPCIITAKEVAYPPKLKLQTYVNGQLRQDSCTDQMIFDINRIVTELSQGMTLKAGTIIITGTPKGVGMGMDPPTFLKKGDVVECRIEEIGSLINTVE